MSVRIVPLLPSGGNSTMFTECCEVAINNDQLCCPRCKEKVVGWDEPSDHKRGVVRWLSATRNWKR